MIENDGVLVQARELLAGNRADSAIEVLMRARSARGLEAEETYLLGVAHFRKQAFALSENLFRETIAMKPDSHLAVYYLGLTLERQGLQDQAMAAFRTSVRLDPNFEEGLRKLHQPEQRPVSGDHLRTDQKSLPMSDFFIPDGPEELDAYRDRKTKKQRAQYSTAWHSTPWPIRIFQLLFLIMVVAFLALIAAFLVPEMIGEFRS